MATHASSPVLPQPGVQQGQPQCQPQYAHHAYPAAPPHAQPPQQCGLPGQGPASHTKRREPQPSPPQAMYPPMPGAGYPGGGYAQPPPPPGYSNNNNNNGCNSGRCCLTGVMQYTGPTVHPPPPQQYPPCRGFGGPLPPTPLPSLDSEHCRRMANRSFVGQGVVCVLVGLSAWAAEWFSLLTAVVGLIASALGYTHTRTLDDVRNNRCCCGAARALRCVQKLHVLLAILSVISAGIAASVLFEKKTAFEGNDYTGSMVFAVVNFVSCGALCVGVVMGFVWVRRLGAAVLLAPAAATAAPGVSRSESAHAISAPVPMQQQNHFQLAVPRTPLFTQPKPGQFSAFYGAAGSAACAPAPPPAAQAAPAQPSPSTPYGAPASGTATATGSSLATPRATPPPQPLPVPVAMPLPPPQAKQAESSTAAALPQRASASARQRPPPLPPLAVVSARRHDDSEGSTPGGPPGGGGGGGSVGGDAAVGGAGAASASLSGTQGGGHASPLVFTSPVLFSASRRVPQ